MNAMATNGIGSAVVHTPQRADLSVRFTEAQQKVILDTCCGGAPAHEARALIAIAEARGLNPILGECYFVKRWDAESKSFKWAVQAAIDSLRIKAEQTGLYAGQDEPEYEYDKEGFVVLARVRVWRKDWPRPAVGVARWTEYVQTTKEGNPTKFWRQMPHNQLAKCAEALALRKAFPAVLAKLYTSEEMGQADNDIQPALQSVPQMEAPRQAPALPPSQVDAKVFESLCVRVDEAETASALNAIASYSAKAHKAGRIADSHFEALKRAVTTKRGLIGQAPEAPASGPKVTEDPPFDYEPEADYDQDGGR